MTQPPRAFFALDLGSATSSAALVGHIGERWRLIAHLALPALADVRPLLKQLAERVRTADPELFDEIAGTEAAEPGAAADDWPRLEARTSPPRRLVVLAPSRRQRQRLEEAAARAGWLVVAGSADDDDPLRLTRLALSTDVHAILLGADEAPSGDERRHLPQLTSLAAAAALRRPELDVVLAGGAAAAAGSFRDRGGARETAREGDRTTTAEAGAAVDGTPGRLLLAPDASAGQPHGAALRAVLEGLRGIPKDARIAAARSIASLAFVLDRSIECVEVGLEGGLRCRADPVGEGRGSAAASHAIVAAASFAPTDPSNAVLESVIGWATIPLDRYRLADRLRDLRRWPWAEADGDGALLRLAAARAALERLVSATPELSSPPMPDLIVAAGGPWAAVPPPVVSLALADLVRRPGVSQLALDAARLLGPLGTIEDETERRAMLRDLSDDLLVPLGSVILPGDVRAGRSAGRLRLRSEDGAVEMDLEPGGIEVVDLPPGQVATAELDFRETVRLGGRGRHFTTQVTGGLGGLLVDLRDVPLRLPDRADKRRAVLDAWQRVFWMEGPE